MELPAIIDEFLTHCRLKELSRHTCMAYRQDLKDYRVWFEKSALTDPFDRPSVLGWLENMRNRNLSPASIKRRIACLRAMFRWLEHNDRLEVNPFHKLHGLVRLPHRLPRNLSSSEVRIILHQSDLKRKRRTSVEAATLAIALDILLATGVRIGELCAICLEDIDVPGETIRIRGKGNRERSIPLVDNTLKRHIDQYMKLRTRRNVRGPHFLFSEAGNPVSPDYVRKKLHGHVEKLPIRRKITPHMFRHTAATRLVGRGVDVRFVQKLLGHASISTTVIYTHVTDPQLKSAMTVSGRSTLIKNRILSNLSLVLAFLLIQLTITETGDWWKSSVGALGVVGLVSGLLAAGFMIVRFALSFHDNRLLSAIGKHRPGRRGA